MQDIKTYSKRFFAVMLAVLITLTSMPVSYVYAEDVAITDSDNQDEADESKDTDDDEESKEDDSSEEKDEADKSESKEQEDESEESKPSEQTEETKDEDASNDIVSSEEKSEEKAEETAEDKSEEKSESDEKDSADSEPEFVISDLSDDEKNSFEEYLEEKYSSFDVRGIAEVTVPEGTEFPITITLPAEVSESDNAYVIHKCSSDEYEKIKPDKVKDGAVTAEFNSLSPVAVIVGNDEDNNEDDVEEDKHHFTYISNEDGSHVVKCEDEGCEYVDYEACVLNEDGICELCGYDSSEKKDSVSENDIEKENTETVSENEIPEFEYQEMFGYVDEMQIMVSGEMPKDAVLSVSKESVKEVTDIIEDSTSNDAVLSFDITITYGDNKEYEPEEFGKELSVRISNIDSVADGIFEIVHIENDGEVEVVSETINTFLEDDAVEFETESFSTYTLTGVTATSSMSVEENLSHTLSFIGSIGNVYHMYLVYGGKTNEAFCIDHGKSASSGDTFYQTYTSYSMDAAKKVMTIYDDKSKSFGFSYTAAQCLVWTAIEGHTSSSDFQTVLNELNAIDTSIISTADIADFIAAYNSLGATNTYYEWVSKRGDETAGYQRFVCRLGTTIGVTPPTVDDDKWWVGDSAWAEWDSGTGTITIKGYGDCWDLNCNTGAGNRPFYVSGHGTGYEKLNKYKHLYNSTNYYRPPYYHYWGLGADDSTHHYINDYLGTAIKHIVVEDGITYLGTNMFAFSDEIADVVIADSVNEIGSYCFKGRVTYGIGDPVIYGVKKVTLPISAVLGYNVFPDNGLSEVNYTKGTGTGWDSVSNTTSMGRYLASNRKVTYEEGITYIGSNTCAISSDDNGVQVFPSTLVTIGDEAFEYGTSPSALVKGMSNIKTITIPSGVKTIGKRAFEGNKEVTALNLSSSLETIDEYAFRLCEKLPSVTIPDSVTTIGDMAFYNCYSLESITGANNVSFSNLGHSIFGLYDSDTAKYSNTVTHTEHGLYGNTDYTEQITSVTSSNPALLEDSMWHYGSFRGASRTYFDMAGGYKIGSNRHVTMHEILTVSYDANGATAGTAPTDDTKYDNGDIVTVKGNTGSLTKTNKLFAGWNTKADGSGTHYDAADTFSISKSTVLYAEWGTALHVTYDGNGATSGSVPTDSTLYANGNTVTVKGNPGSLVKTDYAFTGWNNEADGSGTHYDAADTFTITADTQLYAEWTPLVTLSYDANGADSGTVPASTKHTKGTSATVDGPNTLVKYGYNFNGWRVGHAHTGAEKSMGDSLLMNDDYVLYAQWEEKSGINLYNVTFKANNGTLNEYIQHFPSLGTYDPDEKLDKFSNRSWTYTKMGVPQYFTGWALTGGATVPAFADEQDIATVLSGAGGLTNITLYAVWSEGYMVKFYQNDGTAAIYTTQTVERDNAHKVTKPVNPTRVGYTFVNWYKETGCTNLYDFNSVVTDNLDLYAKWSINKYTVTFDTDGGTPTLASQEVAHGGTATEPANPSKTGYTFDHWENTYDNTTWDFSNVVTDDLTLKAIYTANTYKVRFNANGGTGTMADQTLIYDTADNLNTNAFTRGGTEYSFIGWATSSTGSKVYDDAQSVVNLSSVKDDVVNLYALWKDNKVKLTYVVPGKTSGTVPSEVVQMPGTVTLNNPKHVDLEGNVTFDFEAGNDKTFVGWEIDGVTYTGGTAYTLTTSKTAIAKFADQTVVSQTQTGLEAVYHYYYRLSGIDFIKDDFTVYPILTLTFDNGKKQTGVRGVNLSSSDFTINKTVIDKNHNYVTVAQNGTAYTVIADNSSSFKDNNNARFTVFGGYKDGIKATYSKEKVKAGYEYKKDEFKVVYTYTMLDTNGAVHSKIASDRDIDIVNDFTWNPTVAEVGNNYVTVTESPNGWTDIVLIKGEKKGGGGGKDEPIKEDPINPPPVNTPVIPPVVPPVNPPVIPVIPVKPKKPTPPAIPVTPKTPDNPFEPVKPTQADPEVPLSQTTIVQTKEEITGKPGSVKADSHVVYKRAIISSLIAAIIAGGIIAGALTNFWGWLFFILFAKKRRKWHGILTDEKNAYIKLEIAEEDFKYVQEVIDETSKTEDILEDLKASGNLTFIPYGSRMMVNYIVGGNAAEITEKADESRLYEILKEADLGSTATVNIVYAGNKIDVTLSYLIR